MHADTFSLAHSLPLKPADTKELLPTFLSKGFHSLTATSAAWHTRPMVRCRLAAMAPVFQRWPQPTGNVAPRLKPRGNIARPLFGGSMPQPAKPPGEGILASMASLLAKATRQAGHIHYPHARFPRNDWRTRGDWTARYGREYAVLCAAHFDLSFHCIAPDYAAQTDTRSQFV